MSPINNRWKIIGAGTAIAAIGISGIGFAGSGSDITLPESINLRDRVPIAEAQESETPKFEIVPAPVVGGDSYDSPFDTNSASLNSYTADTTSFDTNSFDSPEGVRHQAQPAPAQSWEHWSADTNSYDSPEVLQQSAPAPAPAYNGGSGSADSYSFDSASFSS